MTTKKYSVIVKNDDEGMFGSESTDGVNVPATIAEYERQLNREFSRQLPEAEFEHQYGPYSGRSVYITPLTDEADHDDIYDSVQDIVGRVYERGTFWVMLK